MNYRLLRNSEVVCDKDSFCVLTVHKGDAMADVLYRADYLGAWHQIPSAFIGRKAREIWGGQTLIRRTIAC